MESIMEKHLKMLKKKKKKTPCSSGNGSRCSVLKFKWKGFKVDIRRNCAAGPFEGCPRRGPCLMSAVAVSAAPAVTGLPGPRLHFACISSFVSCCTGVAHVSNMGLPVMSKSPSGPE